MQRVKSFMDVINQDPNAPGGTPAGEPGQTPTPAEPTAAPQPSGEPAQPSEGQPGGGEPAQPGS